ncbi:MAG: hypothetical protein AAF754_07610 [Pseudomonadota bacterium]
MRFVLLLSLIMAVPAAATSPVAEVICDATDRMEQRLTTTFTSKRIGQGVQSPDQIMEIWMNDQGDWTVVVKYATGRSCIVAMGEHWVQTEPTS